MTTPRDPMLSMLSALSAEVGKQGEAMKAQSERLGEVEATVLDVGKRLKRVTEEPKEPPVPVWSWATMDADKAAEAWAALSAWVRDVLQERYPTSRAALAPCWYKHTDVVEELSALMAAWTRAFGLADSAPPGAIEWLDRWLPGCLRRVETLLQRCRTDNFRHTERLPALVELDATGFGDWVMADLAERPDAP
ncbi:hypothetical protein [Embleya sp. NPDC005971]|uniref:hypothetical protein n=1 Tax=Embleya sp. NPDC005971 TaxID=3156724 RepID=UPI003408BA10